MVTLVPPDWPFRGPSASMELLAPIRAVPDDMVQFHGHFLGIHGMSAESPAPMKHRDLLSMLLHLTYQLHLARLADVEALSRFILQIHQAVRRNPPRSRGDDDVSSRQQWTGESCTFRKRREARGVHVGAPATLPTRKRRGAPPAGRAAKGSHSGGIMAPSVGSSLCLGAGGAGSGPTMARPSPPKSAFDARRPTSTVLAATLCSPFSATISPRSSSMKRVELESWGCCDRHEKLWRYRTPDPKGPGMRL